MIIEIYLRYRGQTEPLREINARGRQGLAAAIEAAERERDYLRKQLDERAGETITHDRTAAKDATGDYFSVRDAETGTVYTIAARRKYGWQ